MSAPAPQGPGGAPGRTARIVRVDARVFLAELEGQVVQLAPRGKLFEHRSGHKNPVVVGDRVELTASGDPPGIEAVLPRKNWLSRIASTHDPREQVLFANVDQLLTVASVRQPVFSSNRADRILAACRWHEIPAVLVLNKIDLADPGETETLRDTYRAAGVEVIETCALDGRGVAALREKMTGRTTALYGGSGAGKSSLLNALVPELALKVGKISKFWDQGRHTTSSSQIHQLGFGAVIDTPGIRVFRLHGATAMDVRGLFPEFERFASGCRFPACAHDHEPGCAVFDAVEAGKIAPTRYASYAEILDELRGAGGDED